MSEEPVIIASGIALRKGGSIQITIPKEVVGLLKLETGDYLVFVYDPKTKRIFIDKAVRMITPDGFSFSISKEVAKKLLKEGQELKNEE